MDMIKAAQGSKSSPVKRRSFGAVINILERKFQMTTKEFEVATGIEYTLLTRYKNGKAQPSMGTILKLADALNMRAGEIVDLMEIID